MADVSDVELHRLGPDDWRVFRDVRMEALSDTPSAFGSTLADERRQTEAEWRARLTGRLQLVARSTHREWRREAGVVVGTVGVIDDGDGRAPELVSMWVHPDWRRRGVGAQLVQAIVEWVRTEAPASGGRLRLWVSDGNDAAERLYARHGFVRSGETQPIRAEQPECLEFGMRLDVESGS